MFILDDSIIRSAITTQLTAQFGDDPDSLIIEELGLCHGSARVDVAVINGSIHGIEIKSDRDTLDRLPRQIRVYSSVLDEVTLVVAPRHSAKALAMIPRWWGVTLAPLGGDGSIDLQLVRPTQKNPEPNLLSQVKLLWRSEALGLLEELHAANCVRYRQRAVIYGRLVEVANPDWLRAKVRSQLRRRTDWRSGALLA